MRSASGRSVIVFNGEIYNHVKLRREIESRSSHGVSWRGHSDTETLLAAIESWGIEEALRAAAGMFAFAFWDCEDRILRLARDRLGEKPLYYGWQNGVFLFGSELKALAAHPAFAGEIERGRSTGTRWPCSCGTVTFRRLGPSTGECASCRQAPTSKWRPAGRSADYRSHGRTGRCRA